MEIRVLLQGVSGESERGWLGWSSVVLLQAEGQNVLFDTGSYQDRPVLVEQLRAHKIALGDVDSVIISHLHFDHIANIDLFRKARWYINGAEMEENGAVLNPTPKPYREWLARQPNLYLFHEPEMDVAHGIRLVHTPGHTPGSCSVLTDGGNCRVAVMGDAVKSRKELCESSHGTAELSEPVQWLLGTADWMIPGHDVPLYPNGIPLKKEESHWIKTNACLEIYHYD